MHAPFVSLASVIFVFSLEWRYPLICSLDLLEIYVSPHLHLLYFFENLESFKITSEGKRHTVYRIFVTNNRRVRLKTLSRQESYARLTSRKQPRLSKYHYSQCGNTLIPSQFVLLISSLWFLFFRVQTKECYRPRATANGFWVLSVVSIGQGPQPPFEFPLATFTLT